MNKSIHLNTAQPARFDASSVAIDGYRAMLGLHNYVQRCGLEEALLELVKIRVSQINGCVYCVAMHIPLARKCGVSEERMHLLPVWREAPIYSPRERAALSWAEALNQLSNGAVTSAVYTEAKQQFSGNEIADLVYTVIEISGWNRLMIASRTPPQIEGA